MLVFAGELGLEAEIDMPVKMRLTTRRIFSATEGNMKLYPSVYFLSTVITYVGALIYWIIFLNHFNIMDSYYTCLRVKNKIQ